MLVWPARPLSLFPLQIIILRGGVGLAGQANHVYDKYLRGTASSGTWSQQLGLQDR